MQRAEALVRSSYHLTKQKTKKLLSSNSAFVLFCFVFPVWVKMVLEPALNSSKAIRPNSCHRTDHLSMPRPERTVRRPPCRGGRAALNYSVTGSYCERLPRSPSFSWRVQALNVLCGDASCMNLWSGMSLVKGFQKYSKFDTLFSHYSARPGRQWQPFLYCLPAFEVSEVCHEKKLSKEF